MARPGHLTIDPDLVERAVAGSRFALEDILAEVKAPVHRFAGYRLRSYYNSQSLADEVTQETLIALHMLIPKFESRDGAPFYSLVWRVASNKLADVQRALGRNKTETWPEGWNPPSRAPEPDRIIAGRDELERVLALVAKLPPAKARVVRLRAEGFTPAEVGELVGLTPNAVRVVHHRALAELRARPAFDHQATDPASP